jgi:hypothetical protein
MNCWIPSKIVMAATLAGRYTPQPDDLPLAVCAHRTILRQIERLERASALNRKTSNAGESELQRISPLSVLGRAVEDVVFGRALRARG